VRVCKSIDVPPSNEYLKYEGKEAEATRELRQCRVAAVAEPDPARRGVRRGRAC